MAKKEKRKWSSKRKQKRSGKMIPFTKRNTKKISLADKLNQVYSSVNLETTCDGRCECCKVAMPQVNYCEFLQLMYEAWNNETRGGKIDLICKSIEYFMHNEFEKFKMKTLIKPCMLLTEEGQCRYYESRPLNCRLYGLWPEDTYNERVDKFTKAYEGLLERSEIPLNTQCPYVKRKDESEPLTMDVINGLFAKLDSLDTLTKKFTDNQIQNKENYRAFHDWLLWTIFGEDWLSTMTSFVLAADADAIDDLIEQVKKAVRDKFAKDNLPDLPPDIKTFEE